MPSTPPTAPWDDAWNEAGYTWPLVEAPSAPDVTKISLICEAAGGRAIKEPHADRSVVMEFPNNAVPGTVVRRKVARCECRRRGLVAVPSQSGDPVRVCVICDAVNRWPTASAT